MNQTFSIGEVAILIPANEEVTIIGELRMSLGGKDIFTGKINPPGNRYRVFWKNHPNPILCSPNELRKKRPPEELSSWDKVQEICGWNPEKRLDSIT